MVCFWDTRYSKAEARRLIVLDLWYGLELILVLFRYFVFLFLSLTFIFLV